MKYYDVKRRKVNKVFRKYIKGSLKEYGNFVKFSYVFERILWIIAIIGFVYYLYNMLVITHDPIDIVYVIMAGGAPFGISIMFKGVYREWILKEYKVRGNEKIAIGNDKIQYSYDDFFGRNLVYQIEKDKLKKVEYYENKGELVIYGKINFLDSNGNLISDDVDKINFLNFFQKDVRDILKEAGFDNINEIK